MQFIDEVVGVLVLQQVPTIQKMRKTVEVPQVQCIDSIVDVPDKMHRQVPTTQ